MKASIKQSSAPPVIIAITTSQCNQPTTHQVIQKSIKRTSIPLICQMMHSQAWNFSELSSYGHFEHDWSDDTLSTLCDDDLLLSMIVVRCIRPYISSESELVKMCAFLAHFAGLKAFHHGAPNDSIFCPR